MKRTPIQRWDGSWYDPDDTIPEPVLEKPKRQKKPNHKLYSLYCWTNHDNGKVYVGIRIANGLDGYICSTNNKNFWSEFYNKSTWSREILATGTLEDIRKLEYRIHLALQGKDTYNPVPWRALEGQ